MPRPIPPEGRWTDRHHLVSFYASDDLRQWIKAEVRRSGRSKTRVIVEALERLRHGDADREGVP
jgi:hypothetical protein